MPRLWTQTIAEHRRSVHDAIVATAAALVAEHGLAAVTMSQIAERAGIGRATLYKYFPDVESILIAWHQRVVNDHLQQLATISDEVDDVDQRLEAVLTAYAINVQHHGGGELAALLHSGEHVARAQQQLRTFIRDLLAEGAATGAVREDIPAEELAAFCLHALTASSNARSKAAVRRLVSATMAGLRPPARSDPVRSDPRTGGGQR